MSGVDDSLKRLIGLEGPIPLARFMTEALLHPTDGYYTNRTVFGTEGDFTTAPEISQVFGELVGLWAADFWQRAMPGTPIKLIELGPGRGLLMDDVLRAARALPAFFNAIEVHLVEASPMLREIQRDRLEEQGRPLAWHDDISAVPDGPAIVLANEFFDALPISQYQFRDGHWAERRITVDENGDYAFIHLPATPPDIYLPADPPQEGDILEASIATLGVMGAIAERLAAQGGAALAIDYGYAQKAYGDTFQAVKGHAFADPFEKPGSADLTAHVNFSLLADVAREAGLATHGPTTQGGFLYRLGIEERTKRLLRGVDKTAAEDIIAGARRLVAPDEMGTLFKVLAVTQEGAPAPAGFEGAA